MLDDVAGGLEPFARRGDVVSEGAIPALDERDVSVLLPVGADSTGDRFATLQAARSRGCRRSETAPKNEVFKMPESAV